MKNTNSGQWFVYGEEITVKFEIIDTKVKGGYKNPHLYVMPIFELEAPVNSEWDAL